MMIDLLEFAAEYWPVLLAISVLLLAVALVEWARIGLEGDEE